MSWKNLVEMSQITNTIGLIHKGKDKGLKFYENLPRLRSEEVCPYVLFTNMITGFVLDFYNVSFLNFCPLIHGGPFLLYSPLSMILVFHLLFT